MSMRDRIRQLEIQVQEKDTEIEMCKLRNEELQEINQGLTNELDRVHLDYKWTKQDHQHILHANEQLTKRNTELEEKTADFEREVGRIALKFCK